MTISDYIIVGGGTAGVTLASRLHSLAPHLKITLLEAGQDHTRHPSIVDPNGMFATTFGGAPDPTGGAVQSYLTAPQKHLEGRQIQLWAANALSGASNINIGVWLRPNKHDLAEVARIAGDDRWTFERMLPYFKRSETWWERGLEEDYHGFEGPVSVLGGVKFPLTETMEKTFANLGIGSNGEGYDGNHEGRCVLPQNFKPLSTGGSERQHASNAYSLEGVDLRCGVRVKRVVFDQTKGAVPRATAVELLDGSVLKARREVILCAGAFKTPQILLSSGIGSTSDLQRLGVPSVVESPGVGQNAFDHLLLCHYFKLRDQSKGQSAPYTGHADPRFFQRGPYDYIAYLPASDALKATHRETKSQLPTVESLFDDGRTPFAMIPAYASLTVSKPGIYPAGTDNPLSGEYLTMLTLLGLPSSRGRLIVDSISPDAKPIMDPNYLSHPLDIQVLREGFRAAARIAQTSPLAEEIEPIETPPFGYPALTVDSDDADLDKRARRFCDTFQHPAGTAAIGSVLDGDLKVKGATGLRVVDLSALPAPVGCMPQSFVYAMAEMIADELSKSA